MSCSFYLHSSLSLCFPMFCCLVICCVSFSIHLCLAPINHSVSPSHVKICLYRSQNMCPLKRTPYFALVFFSFPFFFFLTWVIKYLTNISAPFNCMSTHPPQRLKLGLRIVPGAREEDCRQSGASDVLQYPAESGEGWVKQENVECRPVSCNNTISN